LSSFSSSFSHLLFSFVLLDFSFSLETFSSFLVLIFHVLIFLFDFLVEMLALSLFSSVVVLFPSIARVVFRPFLWPAVCCRLLLEPSGWGEDGRLFIGEMKYFYFFHCSFNEG
jgi:hypothetical protein